MTLLGRFATGLGRTLGFARKADVKAQLLAFPGITLQRAPAQPRDVDLT
jgi:hypothetical protein